MAGKPMRIIHWCPTFLAGGGVAETVLGLANAQTSRGYQVMVVSREYRDSPSYRPRLRTDLRAELHAWDPVRTLMLGKLPASLVPQRSMAVLRSYQPDILHLHTGILPEDALARHAVPRTRAVLTPHGAFYPQVLGRKLRPYVTLLKPVFYSRLAAFHAVSPGEGAMIRRLFRRHQIYVVPNGLSPEFKLEARPNSDRDDTRAQAIKLICVGRLDMRTKGLDILLHAFARAAAQSPRRLELVFVGPRAGSDYAAVAAMIDQLRIADRVLFTGMTDREGVGRYLRTADIYVQTSRWDACSQASIEAIALELPCILSSGSGVSTFPNIAALPHIHIVEPRIEDVTAVILQVAASLQGNREAARQFGPASREFFSWERAAEVHEVVYSRLMAA
jgi:glycosyltransferase involved in cell wall biosynthesis